LIDQRSSALKRGFVGSGSFYSSSGIHQFVHKAITLLEAEVWV
jgi:hypothetical protein